MPDIRTRIDAINVWKPGDPRAPHKTLWVLFALGRWQRGYEGTPHQWLTGQSCDVAGGEQSDVTE